MEEDRIQTTRNRVFIQKLPFGKTNPISMKTEESSVYRVTGYNQINDIINTGYVRSKEKVKGGHQNELFWTQGGDKLYYYDKRPVLEAPCTKVKDNQIGAIPLEDLTAVWIFDENQNKYINVIEQINNYRKQYLYSQEESTIGRKRWYLHYQYIFSISIFYSIIKKKGR